MKKAFAAVPAVALAFAFASGTYGASHFPYLDQFDDGDPLTNDHAGYTFGTQDKPISESDGVLTWEEGGGTWDRTELQTNDTWQFPTIAGTPKIFQWDVGTASVTDTPGTRLQLGVVSENLSRGSASEMWENPEGGIYFDLLFGDDPATAELVLWSADNDKSSGTDGDEIDSIDIDWNWQEEGRTAGIELWENEFRFTFDGDVLATSTYDDANLSAGPGGEFENGFWAHMHGQNREGGDGTVSVTEFRVIPEPASLTLLAAGGLLLLRRRHRSA